VKNLRRKLDPDAARIVETVLGVGYRLGWSRDR
jgi:DNA-binding response OmpR family regulator